MLSTAFSKAITNLFLPGVMKIFAQCLIVYAIAWGVLAWALSALIGQLVGAHGAQGIAMYFVGAGGGIFAAWFLFPLLYPLLVNFFDDKMVAVIEKADYPDVPPAQPPFWPTFAHDMEFSLKALLFNILCLPLYIIPLIGLCVYYALNGWLLGTQFFRMIAGRRIAKAEADALERRFRPSILMAGIAISFFSTIPVLNLAAPLLGVATMLHLFYGMRNRA
jgi:uncharacterized protein involved in cysteine biosynthesis